MIVRLTATAVRDVDEAYEWYQARSVHAAQVFLDRMDEALTRVGMNPEAYASVVGSARRCLLDGYPYSLWFRAGTEVIVFAVLHGKRSPSVAGKRAGNKELR